jgi:hypothetical protein
MGIIMLSTGQKIKNRIVKLPETFTQYGLQAVYLKPSLGKRFKIFVLYLDNYDTIIGDMIRL